jgi:hypothetical protein
LELCEYPLKAALRHKEAGTWQSLSYGELVVLAKKSLPASCLGFAAGRGRHSSTPLLPLVVAYFGILRAGGLSWSKGEECGVILSDSEVRVILSTGPS